MSWPQGRIGLGQFTALRRELAPVGTGGYSKVSSEKAWGQTMQALEAQGKEFAFYLRGGE